jgi:hypothetical protein
LLRTNEEVKYMLDWFSREKELKNNHHNIKNWLFAIYTPHGTKKKTSLNFFIVIKFCRKINRIKYILQRASMPISHKFHAHIY